MNLTDKLELSCEPIQLIQEGKFVRAYNQSYYALCKQLKFKLNPNVKLIKSINQIIVYGGFPVEAVYRYFPHANKTTYGYFLRGTWNLNDYYRWFCYYCEGSLKIQKQISIKPLTEKQLLFLAAWQSGKFSIQSEHEFLQALKNYLQL